MKSAVYRITNVITGHFYIGSSINYLTRWREHKNDLRRNIHHCIYLQRSYNKYYEEAFVYDVLLFCIPEYLLKLEQWFINNLSPDYNTAIDVIRPSLGRKVPKEKALEIGSIHKGNKYNLGRKASINTRSLMSSQRKGRKLKVSTIEFLSASKKKPILQYDISGNFIREWNSVEEAANHVNTTRQNISKCLSGQQLRSVGFVWKYKNPDDYKPFKSPSKSKKVINILTNEVYNNITECATNLGVSRYILSANINNKQKYNNFEYIKYFNYAAQDKITSG